MGSIAAASALGACANRGATVEAGRTAGPVAASEVARRPVRPATGASPTSPLEAGVAGDACTTKQVVSADLDHDRVPDQLTWLRCGRHVPVQPATADFAHPRDTLTLTLGASSRTWTLYSNDNNEEVEFLAEVSVFDVSATDHRALVRATGYGTGDVQSWELVDLAEGQVRRWSAPELAPVIAQHLTSGEYLGKQFETGVRIDGHELELGWLVYRPGEPNCCPSGGVLRVRLRAAPRGLEPARVWRDPTP